MIFMAKNFETLRAKRAPEARDRARALAQKYEAEMALDELRVAQQLTQQSLAELMGMNQASLSKMERQTDMYISSLRSIIRAMGGYLQLEAVFPDGRVKINQFAEINGQDKSNPAKKAGRVGKPRSMAAGKQRRK